MGGIDPPGGQPEFREPSLARILLRAFQSFGGTPATMIFLVLGVPAALAGFAGVGVGDAMATVSCSPLFLLPLKDFRT